jgi:hypothetical protein
MAVLTRAGAYLRTPRRNHSLTSCRGQETRLVRSATTLWYNLHAAVPWERKCGFPQINAGAASSARSSSVKPLPSACR